MKIRAKTRAGSRALVLTLVGTALAACSRSDRAEVTDFTPRVRTEPVARAVDADWPQWRGPERDGRSDETGIADRLPPAGPRVVWERPLGAGFSGISIASEGLFTCFGDDGGTYLVRLDASTGEEVWRHRMGDLFEENYGNGPRSTPTVADGVAYVLSSRGVLTAVRAETGEVVWTSDLGAELEVPKLEFRGYACSPLIEGDLVVVQLGESPEKSAAALDKGTGEIVWTALTARSGLSSPIAATIHEKRQIVLANSTGLNALDPSSGDLLWQVEWPTRYGVNVATPIFLPPDRVFFSSGYDQGAVMVEVEREGDAWSAEPAWTSKRLRNHFNSSVHHEGHLYGFDESMLKCVSAEDGAERWRRRGLGKGSLIYADGVLIVLGEEGLLSLVEATPEEYRELGVMEVFEGQCWTPPTLAAGHLYLRNHEEIACLDLRSTGPETDPAAGTDEPAR